MFESENILMKSLAERLYKVLDELGYTPLCDACVYTDRCVSEVLKPCREMKKLIKIFKKQFPEVKE